MKRLIQLVAVLGIALLALPLSVGQSICLIAQSSQPMSADCCAGMASAAACGTSQTVQAQSCGQGCCTAAPANLPEQNNAGKASLVAPAPGLTPGFMLAAPMLRAISVSADSARRVAPNLHILLHTFRI